MRLLRCGPPRLQSRPMRIAAPLEHCRPATGSTRRSFNSSSSNLVSVRSSLMVRSSLSVCFGLGFSSGFSIPRISMLRSAVANGE
ncbi:hypothetical protein D3C76_1375050 [compost metagenome]